MIKTTLSALLPLVLMGVAVPNDAAEEIKPEVTDNVVAIETQEYTGWTCEGCTIQERMALEAFHERGITDKYAIAALMGNIKQESMFIPDICEGGARVAYEHCHSGGYGLIQWTTVNRYDGLGRHARNIGKSPSTTETQLSYLFTEYQWKRVEPYMKTPGKSIEWYMQHAYKWLGWGVHGERTDYAYHYARELYKAS